MPTQDYALLRLKGAGFRPQRAIDVGAYVGDWTRLWKLHFQDAPVLLVEPQEERASDLRAVVESFPDCSAEQALLGAEPGEAWFLGDETNSRIVADDPGKTGRRIPVQTLWDLVSGTPYEQPDFLKLDVQGHELAVLRRAGPLLGRVPVILLEMSVIRIGPVPIFSEVIAFMADHDYRLYDLCGFNERPLDRALWQVDGLFVHSSAPFAASTSWD